MPPVDELTGPVLAETLAAGWLDPSRATWNRIVATAFSFLAWCRRQGWLDHDSPEWSCADGYPWTAP